MKKSLTFLVIAFSMLFSSNAFAQDYFLSQSAWAFGFGFTYPRFVSTATEVATNDFYGGYLSIQRNFSEHTAFRFRGSFNHMTGEYPTDPGNINTGYETMNVNLVAGDIDFLYYFVPCEAVSPFLLIGTGLTWFQPENAFDPTLNDESFIDYQWNIGFGAEFRIGTDWRIKSEITYHTASNSKIDGIYDDGNGLIGGSNDTWMNMDLGFLYYFGKGEDSHICEIYDGLDQIDYDKIEEIVRRYQTEPTEVDYNRIEDMIKRCCDKEVQVADRWVLIGVNFEFDKATLRPEAIPILNDAAEILLTHPDINVVIEGHTDQIGSDSYNQKLSERRAETVKNFMIAKGVDESRMSTVGKGESELLFQSMDPQLRFFNRRVEFEVK